MRLVRLLVLVLLLAAAVGCTDRAGAPDRPQTQLVPHWTAELPGRPGLIEVTLPVHLETLLPRASASYRLRAEVDLPDGMRGEPLTLAIAHMSALATLSVDDSEAIPLDPGPFDRYRASTFHRWRIPAAATRDGHLSLDMRLSHRFSPSAWIDATPILTTDPAGGRALEAVQELNTLSAIGALAAALVVAFLYGVIFVSLRVPLRDRRRAAYGWFAFGAILGMPYPAFLLGISQPLLGVYEAPFMITALGLGSIAAMFFTRAYVGEPPPSRLWFAVFALVALTAVIVHNPFVSVLVMGPLVVALTLANAIAQLLFVLRYREKHGPQPFTLYGISIAWPATVLLGIPDIYAWLGQGELTSGVRTASLGILFISLYQAAALTREHLLSLKRARELNIELEERIAALQAKQREVQLLNEELRRQIAARSRELAEKLARMEDEELAPPPKLEPGAIVEGRYRILKPLGTGGMGTVYEVERTSDGQHFALKALVEGGGAEARARFAREAQIVANVNHPNVIAIVDIDVSKDGFIFLVMELVAAGGTLHDLRRRERDIPWSLGVLAQVAAGIAAVHDAGIIHRDLKPGNILFSRGIDGRKPLVKITDFGISSLVPDGARISAMERIAMMAQQSDDLDPFSVPPESFKAPVRISELEKERAAATSDSGLVTSVRKDVLVDLEYRPETAPLTDSEAITQFDVDTAVEGAVKRARESDRPAPKPKTPSAPPLTETGLIFGTPQYMAQELSTGTKNATRASDVFALGIIAFEVLTGRRPFPEAPMTAKLHGRPLPAAMSLHKALPDLPADIADLLDRCMSHDPRTRPTARDLATALAVSAAS